TVIKQQPVRSCYLPIIPYHGDGLRDELFNSEDVRVAIPAEVLESLSENGSDSATKLGDEEISVQLVGSDAPEIGLLKTDDRAMILALDNNDKPHALVEGDNNYLYNWVDKKLSAIFQRC
uniref:transcriptional regulator FilR1 domain-containing protein n=1 Tax=Haloarcula sediminis TaxID=3111777 RepID=UPI002D790C6D